MARNPIGFDVTGDAGKFHNTPPYKDAPLSGGTEKRGAWKQAAGPASSNKTMKEAPYGSHGDSNHSVTMGKRLPGSEPKAGMNPAKGRGYTNATKYSGGPNSRSKAPNEVKDSM